MKVFLLILVGFLSGIISGMGIGGGVILIPVLTVFMGISQQSAQNINLIYFLPTGIIVLITHIRNKNIEKRVLLKMILLGLCGAVAGSFLATGLDSNLLRKLFGYFLLVMGVIEFFKRTDKN